MENILKIAMAQISPVWLNKRETIKKVEQSIKDSGLLSKLDFVYIPEFLNNLVSGLGSFSIGLFSVLFISFFFFMVNHLHINRFSIFHINTDFTQP